MLLRALRKLTSSSALTLTSTVMIISSSVFARLYGKSEGLGAMSGSSDTFFGMNKCRSLDAKLQKLTVVFAVVFFLLTGALALFS